MVSRKLGSSINRVKRIVQDDGLGGVSTSNLFRGASGVIGHQRNATQDEYLSIMIDISSKGCQRSNSTTDRFQGGDA